jgi:hypothetical protein
MGAARSDAEEAPRSPGTILPYWPGGLYSARGLVTILSLPNPEEVRVGRWGVGRPSVLLRQALNSAGLSVRDECAYVAVDHAHAFEMWQAIEAADTPYLLLVGGEALKCWRSDVRMQQVAGGMYPATMASGLQRMVGVVQAPEAVLRTQGTVDATEWRRGIERWVAKVTEWAGDNADGLGAADPLEGITWACRAWDRARERVCGDHAYGWDRGGLPWCKKHLVEGWDGAEKARDKGRKEINMSLQEGLEL